MKRILPNNLTFEQFKALADRQPSLEGNWLYRLTHKTLRDDYEFPEFRLFNYRYYFLTLAEAEKYMREKLAFDYENYDTYRFLIDQIPVGGCEYDVRATWVYNKDAVLVESAMATSPDGRFPDSSFFGRSNDRIRFHRGDIVEVDEGEYVHLAIVGSYGPTVEWFWDLYQRTKAKGYYAADDSDDNYYVVDGLGCHDHPHVTKLMKPTQPVPQDIREYFEECLALSDSVEDNWDSRILGMNRPTIFEATATNIKLHYAPDFKKHRLILLTTDEINENESERILPQDFSEEELRKISEWLNFKKYGKSRLWYLIREWNERNSCNTIPALSPDTPLQELLK